MENLKHTISRGYTRKINLGNYESADFFSNHSQELLDPTEAEVFATSMELEHMARKDVADSIKKFMDDRKKKEVKPPNEVLSDMIDKASKGEAIDIEQYQDIVEAIPEAKKHINDAKKAYKRSIYKSVKKQDNGNKSESKDGE